MSDTDTVRTIMEEHKIATTAKYGPDNEFASQAVGGIQLEIDYQDCLCFNRFINCFR